MVGDAVVLDELTRQILLVLGITFTSTMLFVSFLTYNYYSLAFGAERIREKPEDVAGPKKTIMDFALGSISSAGVVTALFIVFRDELFTLDAPSHWVMYFVQPLLFLVIYDLVYYFSHRFIFHNRNLGLFFKAHAKHHKVRHPVPIDAIFVHPLENAVVMCIICFSIWLLSPMNIIVFGISFYLYANINLLLHSGLTWPAPFSFLGYLAKIHDRHHVSMESKNYASITVFPDFIFGTKAD